jgi:hypothetical protein
MIKIIRTEEEWTSWLHKMDSYDFYHTYEYHNILKKQHEEPLLIIYEADQATIGIPLVKRKIKDAYFDCTSVHGYLGPISKGISYDFDNAKFALELSKILKKENVVSVFSKLNPYIEFQREILSSIGKTECIGELVYYDQEQSEETQLKQYNRNTKQKLRQLKNICTVKNVIDEEKIYSFINYYYKSMKRLMAKEVFFFTYEYFSGLLHSNNFKAKMLLAIHNETGEIMGGVFCTNTKEIAHVELAFTNESYYKESPIRILFEECRKFYKNGQLKYLNLGGGSGGREGSLMRFKSTFTQNYKEFCIWKFIVIPEVYEKLQTKQQVKIESDFFPKYRLTIV